MRWLKIAVLSLFLFEMGKRVTVPLALGGQYSVGNAASIPDGYVRALNNHLTRPGRLPARPPFTYDSLMSINGLVNFDDTTNRATRLLAINTSRQVFEKATSSETWGAANGTTISGTRLTDWANYRGITYMMFDDGTGLPSGAASFDGTNVSTSPFDSVLTSRGVVTYDERLYFFYPRMTFKTYLGGLGPHNDSAYNQANWSALNNCTIESIVNGATTTKRLTTTSTGAGAVWMRADVQQAIQMPATSAKTTGVFTMFIRPVSSLGVDTPLSIELNATNDISRSTNYTAGQYRVTGGFFQECTTGGATAVGAPAFNATVGGTTADGSVVWTNRGSAMVGSSGDLYIVDGSDWRRIDVKWTLPGITAPDLLGINPKIKFYNTATPALTVLGSYDLAYQDGLADGDVRKANYGWQLTVGDYYYPFHNSESSTVNTATVDLEEVVWSEIGLPKTIRASNTYKLREAAGKPRAGTAIGGRLMVAKSNAIWQFQDTGDADIPIRREKFMAGIGVLGPRAHDKFEDEWFFVGENGVYSYRVGNDIPKELCGPGMRETVMAKGANWVESQSTYKRPLLAIDQTQLIVWVYTQKGKLFAYDLRSQRWSTHYVSNGAEVDAMIWNSNTGNFYVSFGGYGLARMDYAATANDTIDNTATEFAGDMSFVLPPLKISTLRFDAKCEGIKLLYASSISQTGPAQTLTASISYDQGATYPNSVSYTPFLVSTAGDFVPITLDIEESGPSITLKVARSGKLGEGSWSLAEIMEMKIKINRGEYDQKTATVGSVNL